MILFRMNHVNKIIMIQLQNQVVFHHFHRFYHRMNNQLELVHVQHHYHQYVVQHFHLLIVHV
jgi:hypothetical protein